MLAAILLVDRFEILSNSFWRGVSDRVSTATWQMRSPWGRPSGRPDALAAQPEHLPVCVPAGILILA